MEEIIKLTLLKEDFETSEYINCDDCALARAIKRSGCILGGKGVGGFSAELNGIDYEIVEFGEVAETYLNPTDITVTLKKL